MVRRAGDRALVRHGHDAVASVGISFLFRPLGAYPAGSFGDRYGRCIIPPILLLLLRILQGLSAGGEWGGAALMTGAIAPDDQFLEWGWRVPFLVSIVLIVVGYFVRRAVEESSVFEEIAERKEQHCAPTAVLFKKFTALVIIAALVFAGSNANGSMITGGFVLSYTTDPTQLALPRTDVLLPCPPPPWPGWSSPCWAVSSRTGSAGRAPSRSLPSWAARSSR